MEELIILILVYFIHLSVLFITVTVIFDVGGTCRGSPKDDCDQMWCHLDRQFLRRNSFKYDRRRTQSNVSTCTFPRTLWYKQWYMTNGDTNPREPIFENSTVKNFKFPWTEYSSYNCYLQYDSVYVLRSSSDHTIYMCIKFLKKSDNVYFTYLLSEQMKSGNGKINISSISPKGDNKMFICSYCNYTSSMTTFLLKLKQGDYENITFNQVKQPTFCDPCKRSCHVRNPTATKKSIKKSSEPQTFIVGIVIATFCVGGFLIGLCLYFAEQRKKKRKAEEPEEVELKQVDSDQTGPLEDFQDIPSGEIRVETIDS